MIIPYTERVRHTYVLIICLDIYIYKTLHVIMADDEKCFKLNPGFPD